VPTAQESGLKAFVLSSWVGLLAPAGMPATTIARVNAALNSALADPQLRRRLQELGMKAEGGSAERMRQQIRDDGTLYRRIAADAKLRFE